MTLLRRTTSVLFTLFLFALLPACSTENPTQTVSEADLVILGGVLLDMVADHADPKPLKALVIRGGKIDRIILADSIEAIPSSLNTIQADSNFILPGFFDAHVHFRPWLPDASIWKRASSYYGITTLFDTGPCGDHCAESGQDPNEWIKAYKDFMNSSAVPDGPTLFMTGRRIQSLDGTHPLGVKLSSRGEVATYLDSLVTLGVDGVKVESSLSAELRTIVMEEANARGLPVVGHSRDANESIAAGMKFIEHMWPITSSIASSDPGEKFGSPQHDHLMALNKAPELIRSLVDNGVYINPTMMGRHGYFAESMNGEAAVDFQSMEFGGLFSDMPEHDKEGVRAWWARADEMNVDQIEIYKESLRKVEEFLILFSEAGGKILVATDSGEDKLVGINLHREMKMLADAGIAPYRILLGATRWPAEMTYKNELIGTIEQGKQADIVLLGSDPTTDIRNSRDIRYVIKAGTVLRGPTDCSVIMPPVSVSCSE
ncbi:MAG: amidohydrolase family protein [Proteobacteria bacterium]|nr:amidohydrolase family protein [Pseudomonadota bacterium]